jgi:catechol 2,3-dioxygenase-like lactoylglutathione lyase family enzyme
LAVDSASIENNSTEDCIEKVAMITGISAVTLATHDMRRAVAFYRLLDLRLLYGGEEAAFTSFAAGDNFLNLIAQPAERGWSWWGRLIFCHSDADGLHAGLTEAGSYPDFLPRDAAWGERHFHISDPDRHTPLCHHAPRRREAGKPICVTHWAGGHAHDRNNRPHT